MALAVFAPFAVAGELSGLPDEESPGLIAEDGHSPEILCGRVDGLTYTKRHRSGSIERSLGCPPGWQADHRAPIAAGGADARVNLWCQPPDDLAPGGMGWAAKDRLDIWAWDQICRRSAEPGEVQKLFLAPAQWTASFCYAFPNDPRCSNRP